MNQDNNNFLGRWLANDLSEKEKKDFETSQEYLAYKDILRGVEKFERPVFDIETGLKKQKEFNKTYVDTPKSKVIKLRTWIYSAATVAVILFGLKTMFFNTTKVSTAMAETKNWTLPDNSVVTLNADSSIEYDQNSFLEDRTLILKGEAFFDVAKGSQFTVNTKNGDVTVLGTEFNVYSRNTTIEVHCFEGKVSVSNSKNTTILTPGKGTKSLNNQTFTPLEIKESKPGWIQQKSTFNQVRLARVIAELERQYDVTFTANDIDTNRLFSGFFTHTDLNKALKTCFEPMNISYIFKNSKNIELKNK
ncbi:FecR family protein [Aquimarina sp. 2201CG14-23]|uniref:FecR family protein n=1 Tax=Aquimarina mycalae TaxID=3040073 RepID=UPI002477EFB0|nr:FecR domain-containing protein [Aquimarina sp. 2201CG14-23]MDH7447718.1 FecR domain-containing protein [Aquimarina sp. 2201CG14-23]